MLTLAKYCLVKSRCLWKVCLVEKWMPFPESFNDGPIPSSSKMRERLGEILLTDLSYSNQVCLDVSSEVTVSRIRANSQGMRLQRQSLSLHKYAVQTYIDSRKNNNAQIPTEGSWANSQLIAKLTFIITQGEFPDVTWEWAHTFF